MSYHFQLVPSPPPGLVDMIRGGLRRFNLAQVPALADLPGQDLMVAAFDEQERFIGGVNGEADLGWLYIDSLWVAERVRQHGWGSRLMVAAEQAALRQGLARVYLMTADFQALGFYQKLGYRIIGQNANRPAGHTLYYLDKVITPAAADTRLIVYSPPQMELVYKVEREQIAASPVPIHMQPLAILVRGLQGQFWGGLYGNLFWQWFDLRYLWLDEAVRGQGCGARLLGLLEAWLHEQDAVGICTDTLDWQALAFYRHQGYSINFTLPERPPGHTAYFLHKQLVR